MAVGMAGLAFGGGTEDRGNVVEALDVGLLREVEVAAVGLALAGEGVFQVLFGLAVLQRHDSLLLGEFVCRSEEHTSELQSLMRISYAVFCLKKKRKIHTDTYTTQLTYKSYNN